MNLPIVISEEVWKLVPEVGDRVRTCVTQPHQVIVDVRPYTGRYPQWFTHFVTYTSPFTDSGFIEGCWPMGGACWAIPASEKDRLVAEEQGKRNKYYRPGWNR